MMTTRNSVPVLPLAPSAPLVTSLSTPSAKIKIITTGGEGGLLTMDDDTAWRTAWAYKDHGKSYEAIYERDHPPGFRYVYESFGTNWRMLEVQAAIGRLQLRKLPEWHARCHAIGSRIDAALRELSGLRVPVVPDRLRHGYYRTYAYVRPDALRSDWDRQRVIDEIAAQGVPCYVGSAAEIYLEKAFVTPASHPPSASRSRRRSARRRSASCSIRRSPTCTWRGRSRSLRG